MLLEIMRGLRMVFLEPPEIPPKIQSVQPGSRKEQAPLTPSKKRIPQRKRTQGPKNDPEKTDPKEDAATAWLNYGPKKTYMNKIPYNMFF
jgi:hypothetical protein